MAEPSSDVDRRPSRQRLWLEVSLAFGVSLLLAVNLNRAKALAPRMPPSVLGRAAEVLR